VIAIWNSKEHWADSRDEKISFVDLGADVERCETLLKVICRLRGGRILGILWDDVDWRDETVYVRPWLEFILEDLSRWSDFSAREVIPALGAEEGAEVLRVIKLDRDRWLQSTESLIVVLEGKKL
jgi:integrase